MNPINWLRLSSLALLATAPAANIRWMQLQWASVWTATIMGLFSLANFIIGTGWLYTAPVALAAIYGVWHSHRQLARVTVAKNRGDYVIVS